MLNLFNEANPINYFADRERVGGTAINFDETAYYAKQTPDFATMKAAQGVADRPALPDGQRVADADRGSLRREVHLLDS